MSKLLANQISNYNDNGPVEVKDGINVATGKPFQVAGAAGTSGQYLKSTGSSVAWTTFPTTIAGYGITDAFSGAYADLTGKPSIPSNLGDLSNVDGTAPSASQVLKWNGSAWAPAPDTTGISLTSLSLAVNSAGAANLTYNNTSGQFTYTPPDLSSYLTSVGIISDHTDVTISNIQNNEILKFNSTTSKWENKPDSAGATTLGGLNDVTISGASNGQVLKYNGTAWVNDSDATGSSGSSTFVGLSDTPANFTSQAGKYLKVNAGATALEYTDAPSGSNLTIALNDLSDVDATTGAANGKILKYNGSSWEIADDLTGGGGSATFTGLSDTPANLTAGKYLKVNAGATALEYTDLPSDNDTTYGQQLTVANATPAAVQWDLVPSVGTADSITLTAGNNITFSAATVDGVTINASGGSGASVTTDDNAPGSATDGDLWWKSDEGRLKVYYTDTDGSQWVDASPPMAPPATLTALSDTPANYTSAAGKYLRVNSAGNAVEFTNNIGGTMSAHIIPDTNAAYDLGNAEYKIRHLFLSDNTVYFQGDFLKVAQHNSGSSAGSASYLIPLAKLKDALNASADYEAFKTAILAITDA